MSGSTTDSAGAVAAAAAAGPPPGGPAPGANPAPPGQGPGPGPGPGQGPGQGPSPSPGNGQGQGPGPAPNPGRAQENSGSQSETSDQPANTQPTETAPESHSIGSGQTVADATADRGAGSRRRAFLRQADRIRTVEGDAVGRDKVVNIFGTEETVRLPLMAPVLVESARSVFVAPGQWDDVLAVAVHKRVVVLRGTVGHGRTTAALRLLPHSDPVYHLGAAELARLPDVLLTADQDTTMQDLRGAGFVLDDAAEFGTLTASVLRGLEAALDVTDARLVLAADAASALPAEGFLDHVVDLPAQPDLAEVLAAHLRRRLDEERTARLLARPGIRDLVAEQLTAGTACSVAVRLADILADEELGGGAEPEPVARRLSRRAADDFSTWFAGLRDIETRCHAVALAVLEGVGQETVAVAAEDLRRRLEPEPPVLVTDTAAAGFRDRGDPFTPTQDELLGRLRARTSNTTVTGPFGTAPAEVVGYLDPAYPAAVLRHVWTRHRIHDDLLDWLTGLAEDPSEQIRILAGSALGTLATLSFDFVCRRVLIPWVFDEDRFRREAVAYALRVVAAQAQLRPAVQALTRGWYADRDKPLGQATAALVHGLGLGRQDPAGSAEAVLRLLAVDDSRVGIAVGHALAELVATGEPERARTIVARLADAVLEHETTLSAQLGFLLLGVLILAERPVRADGAGAPTGPASPTTRRTAVLTSQSADRAGRAGNADKPDSADKPGSTAEPGDTAKPGGTVTWPYLLDLAAARPDARGPVVRLWRHVLDDAPLHEEAASVLTAWASMAESDPDLCEAFVRLGLAVARDHDRVRRILIRLADTWTEPDNLAPLPKTGDALRRVLAPSRELP
ncbi:hypothetical protein ABH926_009312 [Catenulispora sp. GP43]|uniref:hypothetical protein n=1 Tax=Catenulispora sp. GP43 TaxID=3156263 RepID=UPI00351688DF